MTMVRPPNSSQAARLRGVPLASSTSVLESRVRQRFACRSSFFIAPCSTGMERSDRLKVAAPRTDRSTQILACARISCELTQSHSFGPSSGARHNEMPDHHLRESQQRHSKGVRSAICAVLYGRVLTRILGGGRDSANLDCNPGSLVDRQAR